MVGVGMMKSPFSRTVSSSSLVYGENTVGWESNPRRGPLDPVIGRRSKVNGRSSNDPSVNEEYKQAFRTQSYIEMLEKVQVQLTSTGCDRLSSTASASQSQPHLSDCLLEPTQKTLNHMTESLDLHQLLVDYFQTSREACDICETLLKSIHQTRLNYRRIRRVTKMSKLEVRDDVPDYTDEQCDVIFRELEGFSMLKNPLQVVRPAQFQVVHDSNTVLLQKLTSRCRNFRKKAKVRKLVKKFAGSVLVMVHTALVIALLVLAFHTVIGVATAPALVGCSCSLWMKKPKHGKGNKTSMLEQLSKQLDVAAKGTFILINDFDTISRQVWRLCDENEHCKEIARMCVRNRKSEVLKEVVKELQMHEDSFLEQLEDLEEHVFLCLHTINRSRRLVMQEILENNDMSISSRE